MAAKTKKQEPHCDDNQNISSHKTSIIERKGELLPHSGIPVLETFFSLTSR
jgi:hypothetical protein